MKKAIHDCKTQKVILADVTPEEMEERKRNPVEAISFRAQAEKEVMDRLIQEYAAQEGASEAIKQEAEKLKI